VALKLCRGKILKLKLPKIPGRGHAAPLIGVDVGSSSIKLARIEFDGPNWKVATAGVIPMDAGADASERIRGFLREHRVPRPWRAAGMLPGKEAEIRILNVPAGDASSLPRRVMAVAEQVLPSGTEDTILDFYSMGGSFDAGEKTERVLLAAASRRAVNRRLEFLEKAGMVPETIELTPWALARAVRFTAMAPEDAPFAILDFGHSTSTVIVLDENGLFLSRSVRTGSKTLTEKVRKELDLDGDRAEQLKGERGLHLAAQAGRSGGGNQGTTLVAEILDDLFLPTLSHLADEIEKSIAFHSSESQGEMLDHLVLTGGGARLKNLDVYLSARLGLQARILAPEAADSSPGSEETDAGEVDAGVSWPLMAGALGLSLRGRAAPDGGSLSA